MKMLAFTLLFVLTALNAQAVGLVVESYVKYEGKEVIHSHVEVGEAKAGSGCVKAKRLAKANGRKFCEERNLDCKLIKATRLGAAASLRDAGYGPRVWRAGYCYGNARFQLK